MERAMDLRPDMAASLGSLVKQEYQIPDSYYFGEVKRGLRNSDGTGVLIGVTKVGSVQGYLIEDGRRVPMPGRLYYRGIDLNEIVEAHRKSGTFGYEEVAYLLLMDICRQNLSFPISMISCAKPGSSRKASPKA